MAFKSYGEQPAVDEWVTLGGVNKTTNKANPKVIEGYYLGVMKGTNKFDPGKEKTTIVLRTAQNVKVGVNVPTNLKIRLERAEKEFREKHGGAPAGVNTRIEFLDEVPSKKGNPLKLFSVQFDADDRIDVNLASFQDSQTGREDEDEEDLEGEEEEERASFSPSPSSRAKPSSGSDADRQAKLQALLSKKS